MVAVFDYIRFIITLFQKSILSYYPFGSYGVGVVVVTPMSFTGSVPVVRPALYIFEPLV